MHLLAERNRPFIGLVGLQKRMLGERGLDAGYLTVDEQIAQVPAKEWTDEHLKRRVRPTHRCMIEVY